MLLNKTKSVVISKKLHSYMSSYISQKPVEHVHKYAYLHTIVNHQRDNSEEVKPHIEKANVTFNKIDNLFKS